MIDMNQNETLIFKNISKLYSQTDFIINPPKRGGDNIIGKLPVKFNQDSYVYNPFTITNTLVSENCGFKNKILNIEGDFSNMQGLKVWDFLDQQNGYKVDEKYYLSEERLIAISKWNAFEKPLEKIMDNNSTHSGALTTRSFDMTSSIKLIKEKARIRKLTPREALRLMGLK